jgi:ABC-2 type transport system ATP-binding protein
MIEAEKLTKRYRPVTAVGGLTSAARSGHVTGFLGPNGAGGAVAIRVIAAVGRDGPSCPAGSGLAGLLAGGRAGSRLSARQRQRQHRR